MIWMYYTDGKLCCMKNTEVNNFVICHFTIENIYSINSCKCECAFVNLMDIYQISLHREYNNIYSHLKCVRVRFPILLQILLLPL